MRHLVAVSVIKVWVWGQHKPHYIYESLMRILALYPGQFLESKLIEKHETIIDRPGS